MMTRNINLSVSFLSLSLPFLEWYVCATWIWNRTLFGARFFLTLPFRFLCLLFSTLCVLAYCNDILATRNIIDFWFYREIQIRFVSFVLLLFWGNHFKQKLCGWPDVFNRFGHSLVFNELLLYLFSSNSTGVWLTFESM